jgi:voltage-gated potassium channel Kch
MTTELGGAVAQVGREPLAKRTITGIRFFFAMLGLISMILGYIGLESYTQTHEPAGQRSYSSDVLYFDVELFLVQSTPLANGGPVPWQLQVARFSAPAAALYAFGEFSAAVFAGRFRRSRLRRMKGHAIVCGADRTANLMAQRLRASGVRVVVVTPEAPGAGDWDTLVADPRLPASLLAAGADRAASIYSCLGQYEDNAQAADAAERIQQRYGHPRRIHILIQDLGLCTALRARRWSVAESAGNHVDFFNLDELAALATVRGDADSAGLRGSEIAIVGTGAFARSVLLESARQQGARGGSRSNPLEVTLIAEDAFEVAAELTGRYAFLESCCRITPRVESFDDVLAPRRDDPAALPLRRLYLCQEDEGQAFTAAIDTALRYQSTFTEIVVRLDRTAGLVGGFRTDRSGGSLFDALGGRLRLVDVSAEGCDPALIEDGLTEQLARACHQHYLSIALRSGKTVETVPVLAGWEDLDDEYREACRAQIVDLGRKLSMIGCLLSPRHAGAPRFAFHPDELEYLAEREHERWSADRRRAGWLWGTERDYQARLHPSLVPWKELSEQERDKDREAVLTITPILADAGLMPIRTRPDVITLPIPRGV